MSHHQPSRLRIIVTGMVALYPVGGVVWDYLQYLIGFARLGHDVFYCEDTWAWPFHPIKNSYVREGDYSADCLARFFERFAPDLAERWHYVHLRESYYGIGRQAFSEIARTADVFLNVSGASAFPEELGPRCIKIFLDTDPGYNQIMLSERFAWSENVDRWCRSVLAHDHFFTYAENINRSDCRVPNVGLKWSTTRMPVVMDCWRVCGDAAPPSDAPFTTVMTWNAFKGPLTYQGVEYGSKGREFEKIAALPQRLPRPFVIAVGGLQAPLEAIRSHGWQVVDAPSATLTPSRYQDFIGASKGEISIAKHVYVALRTGWFSCRSACYLAAGRPVVVQDTKFSHEIPTGEGLFAFSNLEEAVRGVEAVDADYPRHQRAARELARSHFDSNKVLGDLLKRIGL